MFLTIIYKSSLTYLEEKNRAVRSHDGARFPCLAQGKHKE